jgi:hypothetical protein
MRTILSLLFLSSIFIAAPAVAQNTSGVHSPVVNEGHKSFQYRLGFSLDDEGEDFRMKHRFHYQQSLNGDFRWRVIGQTRKSNDSDFDLDFLRAELLWELSDDEDVYKTGLRFDGRVRDDNRPEQFAVNWTNRYSLPGGWDLRGILIATKQTGDNARDGIGLESRARLARKISSGQTLGVDVFSTYGYTGNIGGFDEQRHVISPFISTKISKDVTLFGGPQIGISEAAPNLEARLWVTRGF